jgi:hypothetical protein
MFEVANVIILIYKLLIFSNMDKTGRRIVQKELQKDVYTANALQGVNDYAPTKPELSVANLNEIQTKKELYVKRIVLTIAFAVLTVISAYCGERYKMDLVNVQEIELEHVNDIKF